jgi:NhaP-type Na+/H+ or K+/H+ antiporter
MARCVSFYEYSCLDFFLADSLLKLCFQVLLLSFLPGLIFLDSYNTNVYLFKQAFSQILVFAFPMSLCGTILTALVAYFVLPYGWSSDLCMLLGSILAATDPVAVAVLLNELGAPPRLRTHIAGESLLNDGAAVVFFQIFSARFFFEMGVEGVGEEIGWIRGIIMFLRLSFGGAIIGVLFGVLLVGILFNLNRRLSREECVFQVCATLAIAYLSFFTSEVLLHCSGILAVVFCGVTTKSFGETVSALRNRFRFAQYSSVRENSPHSSLQLFNDTHLTHDFIQIFECLLNTTIFTLGGAVWASVIPDFTGLDWLYLLILYAAVVIIRFVLMALFFPLTSRIGVGLCCKEMIFMSWGGLRGAVGIALALLLSAEVFEHSEADSLSEDTRRQFRQYVQKLFGMIGGVACLSLIIAGPTSGPLLRVLGLVTPTETRSQVVSNYEKHLTKDILVEFMTLQSQKRFQHLDYGIVKERVSILRDVSPEIFHSAIELYKKKFPGKILPNIASIAAHITPDDSECVVDDFTASDVGGLKKRSLKSRNTVYCFKDLPDEQTLIEERKLFIECVKTEYYNQLRSGELDSRSSIPWNLLQSLKCAEEAAANGLPMNDWAALELESSNLLLFDRALHAYRVGALCDRQRGDVDFSRIRTKVLLSLSFIKAHTASQETFKAEFASVEKHSLSLTEKRVLDESREQVVRADALINAFDAHDVNAIKSQYACQVLLHKSARYFEHLAHSGLVTEREATVFLERFEEELNKLRLSSETIRGVKQAATLDSVA